MLGIPLEGQQLRRLSHKRPDYEGEQDMAREEPRDNEDPEETVANNLPCFNVAHHLSDLERVVSCGGLHYAKETHREEYIASVHQYHYNRADTRKVEVVAQAH